MTRWILLVAVTAALVAAPATAKHPKHVLPAASIARTIVATWRCQDQLGVPRTQVGQSPWTLPHGVYREWVANLWKIRHDGCIDQLHQRAAIWRRLDRGLNGSPMAGTGRDLETAGRRHGVSPYFIAAIAATESSLGRAACGPYGHNAWGLGNCESNWGSAVPTFETWAEAYEYMADFLHSRWPSARHPTDYHGYAACTSCWGWKTADWMHKLFGVTANVTYP